MSKFPLLTMEGYSTIPDIETIRSLREANKREVNFTIRNQFGSIQFLHPVDLTCIDLDATVKISHMSVEVYKGQSPNLHEGLNVPALLTLTLHKKPSKSLLQSICAKQNASLISYSDLTGELAVKVPHFTRYAFDVSESESEEPAYMENPMIVSLDSEPLSTSSKRPREKFLPADMIIEPEIKPLNFTSGFKFSISPQGKMFLPSQDGTLVAYSLEVENTKANVGLEAVIEEIPKDEIDEGKKMEHLHQILVKLAQTYVEHFSHDEISNESMLWSLFSTLFVGPEVDFRVLVDRFYKSNTGLLNEAQENMKRKKNLSQWLSYWKPKIVNSGDIYEMILAEIYNGNIKHAVKLACDSRNFYLANLISQTSTEFFKSSMMAQIQTWKRSRIYSNFPKPLQDIYEFLSGIMPTTPLNWKQHLTLMMHYSYPKSTDLKELLKIFNSYDSISDTNISAYNPNYTDTCFNLLILFLHPQKYLSTSLFHPFGFQSFFSTGTSWLMFYAIYTLFSISPELGISPECSEVFKNLQFLSAAYAEELVIAGKWDFAVFVLKFLPNSEAMIKKVVGQNVMNTSTTLNIHDPFYVPKDLPVAAMAVFEKSLFEFYSSFQGFLECKQYFTASDLVVNELAPDYIIKYSGEMLYQKLYIEILQKIEEYSKEVSSVILEEDIYIDYCNLAGHFSQEFRSSDINEYSEALTRVEHLCEKIHCLPKLTLKQKTAIGIMESCLNAWRIQVFGLIEKIHGGFQVQRLLVTDLSQNEDCLRFTENLSLKLLKKLNR